MRLRPLAQAPRPTYPARTARRLARRAAVIAGASFSLLLAGCYGASGPGGPDPDPSFNPAVLQRWYPEVRLAGDAPAATRFVCAPEQPAELPTARWETYFEGNLCGAETAWAALEVSEAGTYRLELNAGEPVVLVDVLGPDGGELAQLGPEHATIDVDLSTGLFVLAATSTDPVESPDDFFSMSYYRVAD